MVTVPKFEDIGEERVPSFDEIAVAAEPEIPSVDVAGVSIEMAADQKLQSLIDVITNPLVEDDAYLNSRYFSKKLDMSFSTAYDLRKAIGMHILNTEDPTDRDLASTIKKMELEEWRQPSLEPGPELGFFGRIWNDIHGNYLNQRDLEGNIQRGPLLGLALGSASTDEIGSEDEIFRQSFKQAVKSGWDKAGSDMAQGAIGRVRAVGDLVGSEKLQAWSQVMSSAVDQYYAENPQLQLQLRPDTGVIGTMMQAIKRPEIIVQSAVEMIPMVSAGYLGGQATKVIGLGSKIGTIGGIADSRFGQNYDNARKQNTDPMKAFAQAHLQSIGEGVLEEWSLSAKVDLFKKGFGRWTQKSIAKKSTDILLAGGKAGVRGFTEEASQSASERFWEVIFTDSESLSTALSEALDTDLKEAGGIGAVMEIVLGGGSFTAGKMAKAFMMIPRKEKIAKLNQLTLAIAKNDAISVEDKAQILQDIHNKKSEVQAGLDDTDTVTVDSVEEAKELANDLADIAREKGMDVEIAQQGTRVTSRQLQPQSETTNFEAGQEVVEETPTTQAAREEVPGEVFTEEVAEPVARESGRQPNILEVLEEAKKSPEEYVDVRTVYHVTPEGSEGSILENGLSADSFVSTRLPQHEALVRSINRMNSFETDEEVIAWAKEAGATEEIVNQAIRRRAESKRPGAENLRESPGHLYMTLISSAEEFDVDLVHPHENLWFDIGFKFIGKNPVTLKGRYTGEVQAGRGDIYDTGNAASEFLWSTWQVSPEAGMEIQSPDQVKDLVKTDVSQQQRAGAAPVKPTPAMTDQFIIKEIEDGGFSITDVETGDTRTFSDKLILPEETQAKFKPEARDKGIGLTAAEVALFPKEVRDKIRFQQIQGEKVGFKVGEKQAKAEATRKLKAEKAKLKKRYNANLQESRERARARIAKFYTEQKLSKANRKEIAGIVKEFFKGKEDLDIKARLLASLAKAQNFTDIQKENFQDKITKAIDAAESRALTKELQKVFKQTKPEEMASAFGRQAKKLKDLFTLKKEGEEAVASREELLEFAKAALTEAKELNPDSVTVIEAESLVQSLEKQHGKTPLADLTADDKRELIDLLRGISAMSKQEDAISGERGERKIADRKKAIVSEIKTKPKLNAAESATDSYVRIHTNLESISDNMGGGMSGLFEAWATTRRALTSFIYDVINSGRDAELNQHKKAHDLTKKIVAEHGIDPITLMRGEHEATLEDVKGRPQKYTFTTAELMSIYMHTRNIHNLTAMIENGMDAIEIKRGKEKLVKLRGFTREAIDGLIDRLTPEQRALARDIGSQVMDGVNKKAMNTASLKMDGREIATETNYWPAERRFLGDLLGRQLRSSEILLESLGFLRTRIGTNRPLRLRGFFHTVYRSNKNVASYAGMAPALRDVKSVWSEDVKTEFENAGWSKEIAVIDDFIRSVEGTSQDISTVERAITSVLRKIRARFAESVFALNPKIWARQQLSSLLVAAYVDPKYMTAMRGVSDPKTLQRIFDLSPQTRDRVQRNKYDWDIGDASLRSEFVGYFRDTTTTEAFIDAMSRKDIGGTISAARAAALSGMKYFDTNAIVDVFRVAEAEVKDNRPDLQEGTKQYNDALKQRFEWLTRHTQPMWDAKDRSLVGSSQRETIKQLTMFSSQREQLVRMVSNAIVAYRNNPTKAMKRQLAVVLSVVGGNIALFTAYGLAWAVGVEGREKEAKDVFSELAQNIFGTLFFARPATEVIRAVSNIEKGRFVDVDVESGPISLLVPSVRGAAYLYTGMKNAITNEKGWEDQVKEGTISLIEGTAQASGLPVVGPKSLTQRLRNDKKKKKKPSVSRPRALY